MKGKVKFFNQGKGFGFISGEDGKEYFVHVSGLKNVAVLKENDPVSFDVEQGERGPKAVNVQIDQGGAEAAPADDDQSEDMPEEEDVQEEELEEE